MSLAQPLAWTLPAARALRSDLAVDEQETKPVELDSEMAGGNKELVLSDIVPNTVAGGACFDVRISFQVKHL